MKKQRNNPILLDVADLAGVSKGIASRVLNRFDTGVRINPKTRQKIISAAKELNFKPNINARRLALKKNESIGILHEGQNFFSSTFTMECLAGVYDSAEANNLSLNISLNKPSDHFKIKFIDERAVDGAIIFFTFSGALMEYLEKENIPWVILNPDIYMENDAVMCDDKSGAARAMKYLFSLGHKRICYINHPMKHQCVILRERVYKESMVSSGLETFIGPGPDENLKDFIPRAIKEFSATAFFIWGDQMAWEVYMICYNAGLKIPEDISIISVNNSIESKQMHPPLTTINVPAREMGKKSVEHLIEKIRTKSKVASFMFDEELIPRKSCRNLLLGANP